MLCMFLVELIYIVQMQKLFDLIIAESVVIFVLYGNINPEQYIFCSGNDFEVIFQLFRAIERVILSFIKLLG